MMTRKPGAVLRGNTMRMAQVLNSARHRIPRNFEAHYEFESGRLTEVQVNFDWPAEERARSLDLQHMPGLFRAVILGVGSTAM